MGVRSRLRLAIPVVIELAKEKYSMKKDSECDSLPSQVVVDFTPKGVLGDLWLCVYYFFATILPNNWGPRVFRDWLCLFASLLFADVSTPPECTQEGVLASSLEESVSVRE